MKWFCFYTMEISGGQCCLATKDHTIGSLRHCSYCHRPIYSYNTESTWDRFTLSYYSPTPPIYTHSFVNYIFTDFPEICTLCGCHTIITHRSRPLTKQFKKRVLYILKDDHYYWLNINKYCVDNMFKPFKRFNLTLYSADISYWIIAICFILHLAPST